MVPVHYLTSEKGKVSQLSHCSRAWNNPELCGFQTVANTSGDFEDYSPRHQFNYGKKSSRSWMQEVKILIRN